MEINGVSLHWTKAEKFKTNILSLYINIPYTKENATLASLLPMVLRRGSVRYPSISDVARRLEELFGAVFYSGLRKKGDHAFIYFSLEFISDKFINESIQKEAFEFLKEIVFFPVTTDNAFNKEFVEAEKINLKDEIKGLINDKKAYAEQRIKEITFPDSAYSIPSDGFLEDVDIINEKNLFDFYKKILNECSIDIFYSGSFSEDEALKNLSDTILPHLTPRESFVSKTALAEKQNQEIINTTENMDITQSKLCIMFTTNTKPFSKEYYALSVFNCIFGGSPFSKLFNNVREKLSLAYYVFSRLERTKGTMVISSGIEGDKLDAAYNEIMLWLDKMKNGDFSDEEIISAKKYLETNLNSSKDSLRATEDHLLTCISEGVPMEEIDTLKDGIKKVTREEIINCAKKLELCSVYLLTNKS